MAYARAHTVFFGHDKLTLCEYVTSPLAGASKKSLASIYAAFSVTRPLGETKTVSNFTFWYQA